MSGSYLPGDNPEYLSRQLITYLGNKRALLPAMDAVICRVRDALGGKKLDCADLFSGSGAVSRLLKRHASCLFVNDLEKYSEVLNRCYLTNREDFPWQAYRSAKETLDHRLLEPLAEGIIAQYYAPQRDDGIRPGERVFYTARNARILDTLRQEIGKLPEALQPFFLAPLLSEASIHNNTGGVFKGFYKDSRTGLGKFGGNGENALPRILGEITLRQPVLSDFSCETYLFRQDANALAGQLPPLDLVYLDPPYNQHPYGSNYFMLNLITDYRLPESISRVSGIPKNWNRSNYNKQAKALDTFAALIASLQASYILISYNSEGFITPQQMETMLESFGTVQREEIPYHTYRASRNLSGREKYVSEYLYLLKKERFR